MNKGIFNKLGNIWTNGLGEKFKFYSMYTKSVETNEENKITTLLQHRKDLSVYY